MQKREILFRGKRVDMVARCTVCRQQMGFEGYKEYEFFDYCPRCGAKMDKEN